MEVIGSLENQFAKNYSDFSSSNLSWTMPEDALDYVMEFWNPIKVMRLMRDMVDDAEQTRERQYQCFIDEPKHSNL